MKQKSISERENALKAYRHQKPDWIPLQFDALQYMGVVSGNECGLGSPDMTDVFGAKWAIAVGDPTPDPNSPRQLEDITEWREKIKFPKPSEWDWDAIQKFELSVVDPNKVQIWFSEQGLFDRLTVLMGFEDALCSMLEEPEECKALLERIADYKIELIECVAKYIKPDVFMYTDDVAQSSGLFMGPDLYRKIIKPAHARIIAAIRKTDMMAEQHTCGKCEEIIPDYVDMGVQSFFPAQICNDLEKIQREYSGRLTLVGGFDYQGPVSHDNASKETIEAEAHRIVDSYGELGGFCAAPAFFDGEQNWIIYQATPKQKAFRDEFYRRQNIMAK